MTLVIGGYSYGSLIVNFLPATEHILLRYEKVSKGTAEAEIRLRAISLSAQWNRDATCYREAQHARRSTSSDVLSRSPRAMAVAIGGDESDPGTRRRSHEGRRSLDAVRRSMDRSRMKLGLRQHSRSSEISERVVIEESLAPVRILPLETRYLLISPLLPPVSLFATMFSIRLPNAEDKFVRNASIAIYGEDDFFASPRKLRRWAERLKGQHGSQFQLSEVSGAGHFWREEGSDSRMRSVIRGWLQDASHRLPYHQC
jgi:pimeloyl-ACP methyl ester carboxylesterase